MKLACEESKAILRTWNIFPDDLVPRKDHKLTYGMLGRPHISQGVMLRVQTSARLPPEPERHKR